MPDTVAHEGAIEIDLGRLVAVLWAQRLKLAGAALVAGAVALGVTFLLTPKFASQVRLMPPQQAQSTAAALLGSLGGLAGLAGAGGGGALAGLKNPSDQWVGILEGRTIADALIARFKLRDRYDVEFQYEAREELDDRTRITAGKDGLIEVDVLDEDPKVAAQIANAYVDELRSLMGGLALSEAGQRRMFFEEQLKLARTGMVKADQALQAVGLVEGVIKTVPEASVAALAEFRAQLAAVDVRLAVARTTLAEGSVEVRALLSQRAQLQQQLSQLEQNDTAKPPAGKAEAYIDAVRNVKYAEALFEIMARQYELARADEARDGMLIQVVDAAVPAERKATPKRALIAVVVALITFVLAAAVLLVGTRRQLLVRTA